MYDATDPTGRLLFKVLGMVAALDADLIRMRSKEWMAIARAKGRLRGKQPKRTRTPRAHLYEVLDGACLFAELFEVSRATIYREVQRRAASGPSD